MLWRFPSNNQFSNIVTLLQAVRNETDMEALSVPKKFQAMNSFYKYYSGELVAPVPTIFIGGNHEASNHMLELYV